MREGFNELVEGYIEMLKEDYSDCLSDVVIEELSATYELTAEEESYARMMCE